MPGFEHWNAVTRTAGAKLKKKKKKTQHKKTPHKHQKNPGGSVRVSARPSGGAVASPWARVRGGPRWPGARAAESRILGKVRISGAPGPLSAAALQAGNPGTSEHTRPRAKMPHPGRRGHPPNPRQPKPAPFKPGPRPFVSGDAGATHCSPRGGGVVLASRRPRLHNGSPFRGRGEINGRRSRL